MKCRIASCSLSRFASYLVVGGSGVSGEFRLAFTHGIRSTRGTSSTLKDCSWIGKMTPAIDVYFKNMFMPAYVGFDDRCWKFAFKPVDRVSGWRSVVNKPNSTFQFCDVHHLVLGKHLSRHDYIMMWMIKTMCILLRYETCFFIGCDITSLPSSCPSEHDVPTSGVVGKIWTRIITQEGA